MQASDAIVDCLAESGVDTVFGIPGGMTLPLNRAIEDHPDLRFVMAHHETAVPHQAWGYAESSGRPAATLVVPGPGDMNTMNGLQNALNDCNPLVQLAVETDPATRGGDDIHESSPDAYDDAVKLNVTAETPESVPAEVRRAVSVALTHPMGPVRVGVPAPFLEDDVAVSGGDGVAPRSASQVPHEAVTAAADRLSRAETPVILAGGGVRAAEATAELRSVAETLRAPVVTTRKGKGVFPADHDLFAGAVVGVASAAVVDCLAASDAALCVGTDFDAFTFQGWSYDLPDRLIHVTLHADDLGTGYSPEVGIVADAGDALVAIETELDASNLRSGEANASRAARVRESERALLSDLLGETQPPLPSVAVLSTIREVLPRDAIVTMGASGTGMWADACFDVYDPRDYLNQGSWSSMGTELPTAIGAQLAHPDRDVVALCGDGGLLMAIHELHTAVVEDLPLVVVVFRNDDFSIISEQAERVHDIGRFDWASSPIDYRSIAEGMGMASERAEAPGRIESALADALSREEPVLVEIPTDPHEPQVYNRFE